MMVNPVIAGLAIGAGARLLYDLLTESYKKGSPEKIHNCHSLLTGFQNKHINLPKNRWLELKGHGQNAYDRVVTGLARNGDPAPAEGPVLQGSFGMHTVVQTHPDNPDEDYDIDVGIVFNRHDLVGRNGGEMSPLDVRNIILKAYGEDMRFSSPPELKKNCVRIRYADHHVDMPSYRHADIADDAPYELASSEWKSSNPRAVTDWFNKATVVKSPDETNGRQLRRVTRMIKYYSRSRPSWNSPSGLIISSLVVECFPVGGFAERDDVALYVTMHCILERLKESLKVKHPVLDEYITKTDQDSCMVDFMNHIASALKDLQPLFDEECDDDAAQKIWKKVFKHDFFEKANGEDSTGSSVTRKAPYIAISNPSDPWCN